MNWNDGKFLNWDIKEEVKKAVKIHRLVWFGMFIVIFLIFLYWTIVLTVREKSPWLVIIEGVILFLVVIYYWCDSAKLRKLDIYDFKWIITEAYGIEHMGGRNSHHKLECNAGRFCAGQVFMKFSAGMPVIVIKYNLAEDGGSVFDRLAFWNNPLAYKISKLL